MAAGRTFDFACRGGGMPHPHEFHTQKWQGERLLLEEKLAARKG